jgi:hypothetical protein
LTMSVVFIHTRVKAKYIEKRFIIVKGLNKSLNVILSLKDLPSFINIHANVLIKLE